MCVVTMPLSFTVEVPRELQPCKYTVLAYQSGNFEDNKLNGSWVWAMAIRKLLNENVLCL